MRDPDTSTSARRLAACARVEGDELSYLVYTDRIDGEADVRPVLGPPRIQGIALGWGVDDVALSKPDALIAISILAEDGIPIIGGDVWIIERGEARPAHDNWCSDPMRGESPEGYLEHTFAESAAFVRRYPDGAGDRFFSLVVAQCPKTALGNGASHPGDPFETDGA